MAEKKNDLVEQGNQGASLVVNNAFVDGMCRQLAQKEQLGLSFPADYNYKNELTGAYLILKETTDKNSKCVLETCSQTSIANTLIDMVVNGVSMLKKQCYPVAYGGKLLCQLSVYGNTCIARRYGLDKVVATCIYENDDFKYEIKNGEIVILKHEQVFKNIDNDKIIGVYAVTTMTNGSIHVELMNINQIKKAWALGYGYKEGSGVHEKFKDQMAMKTVKNRALKYIIRTYGTQALSDYVDRSDEIEAVDKVTANTNYDIEKNANSVPFDKDEKPGEVVVEGTATTVDKDKADELPFSDAE